MGRFVKVLPGLQNVELTCWRCGKVWQIPIAEMKPESYSKTKGKCPQCRAHICTCDYLTYCAGCNAVGEKLCSAHRDQVRAGLLPPAHFHLRTCFARKDKKEWSPPPPPAPPLPKPCKGCGRTLSHDKNCPVLLNRQS